jgi:hypothetical protein
MSLRTIETIVSLRVSKSGLNGAVAIIISCGIEEAMRELLAESPQGPSESVKRLYGAWMG